MTLDRPVTPDPYELLPAVPSFSVTSDDVTDGQPLKDDQVADARQHLAAAVVARRRRRARRATPSPASTPTPRRRAGSGTGCWSTCPPTLRRWTAGAGAEGADLPGSAFMCRNDGGGHAFMGAAPPEGDQVHRYFFVVHAVTEPSPSASTPMPPPRWCRSTWCSRPPPARSCTAPTSTERASGRVPCLRTRTGASRGASRGPRQPAAACARGPLATRA